MIKNTTLHRQKYWLPYMYDEQSKKVLPNREINNIATKYYKNL